MKDSGKKTQSKKSGSKARRKFVPETRKEKEGLDARDPKQTKLRGRRNREDGREGTATMRKEC